MNVEIVSRPAGAAAWVRLERGDAVTAEVGAMIAMSPDLQVNTTSMSRGGKGGILKGIRRMFSGENFFLNHFEATADGQELLVGPALVGDIVAHELTGGAVIVQGSSWLASSDGVDIDTTFQGVMNALFSGEGIFWVKCSGAGTVLLNSFGAIYEVDVDGSHVVDTGHIVAFEDSLSFSVTKASGSWIGSFLGGEGLVARFSGRGRLWCQTHNATSFGRTLGPHLKPRQEG